MKLDLVRARVVCLFAACCIAEKTAYVSSTASPALPTELEPEVRAYCFCRCPSQSYVELTFVNISDRITGSASMRSSQAMERKVFANSA